MTLLHLVMGKCSVVWFIQNKLLNSLCTEYEVWRWGGCGVGVGSTQCGLSCHHDNNSFLRAQLAGWLVAAAPAAATCCTREAEQHSCTVRDEMGWDEMSHGVNRSYYNNTKPRKLNTCRDDSNNNAKHFPGSFFFFFERMPSFIKCSVDLVPKATSRIITAPVLCGILGSHS